METDPGGSTFSSATATRESAASLLDCSRATLSGRPTEKRNLRPVALATQFRRGNALLPLFLPPPFLSTPEQDAPTGSSPSGKTHFPS